MKAIILAINNNILAMGFLIEKRWQQWGWPWTEQFMPTNFGRLKSKMN